MTKPIIQNEIEALVEAVIDTGSDWLALKDGQLFTPVRPARAKGIFDLDFGFLSTVSPVLSIFSDPVRHSDNPADAALPYAATFSSVSAKSQIQLPKSSVVSAPAAMTALASPKIAAQETSSADAARSISFAAPDSSATATGGGASARPGTIPYRCMATRMES